MRKLMFLLTLSVLTVFGGLRDSEAATIGVGSGWVVGSVQSTVDVLSYDFTLASNGVFSLSDCCAGGDVWSITGSFSGTSVFALAPIAVPLGIGEYFALMDSYWLDTNLSRFQIELGAGNYSISVTNNGAQGFGAGAGARVDLAAVPLPAAGLMLMAALAGLGAMRRRKSA